jgi:rubrerythrin
MGGAPATRRDIRGFLIEAFTAIASHGDRSAIFAMRANEEITNRSYASTLEKHLPIEVRNLVERNYEDETKHLAWIKTMIESRAWEKGKAA